MSAIFQAAAAQYRLMKQDYDAALEAHFLAADAATIGYMVNRAGLAKGVSAWSLFKGNAATAYKYASDELVEFWEHEPRPNLNHYERLWWREHEEAHESYREYGWGRDADDMAEMPPVPQVDTYEAWRAAYPNLRNVSRETWQLNFQPPVSRETLHNSQESCKCGGH